MSFLRRGEVRPTAGERILGENGNVSESVLPAIPALASPPGRWVGRGSKQTLICIVSELFEDYDN